MLVALETSFHEGVRELAGLPITCTLSSAELVARREELLPWLLAQSQESVALPDGFRWRFDPSAEILRSIAQIIDAERQCCHFMRFILTVEPDGGPIWLEVSGPEGTTEFLLSLMGNGQAVQGAE